MFPQKKYGRRRVAEASRVLWRWLVDLLVRRVHVHSLDGHRVRVSGHRGSRTPFNTRHPARVYGLWYEQFYS